MAEGDHIYLKLKAKVQLPPKQTIRIHHVAELVTNSEQEQAIRGLPLHMLSIRDGNRHVVDVIQVIQVIHTLDPGLVVCPVGSQQTLVEIVYPKRKMNILLVAFIWIVLFIGSGLAIMNFHTDVSMMKVHQRLYELVTGAKNEHPLIIQIPYSIGVGAGMILFFNHVFRKRFNEEPSPLELEMFLYQQNLDQYVITHEKKEGERHDR
ncbi:stage V sporulation protein AA [Aneurinibacillus tyrosinisolvens]|uniref:stage V sporulation protein AA n=1 Tax=Aneurinibacillus tyrosinisolvens TaxID=1443435 RepID=UPI00063F939C|nr:stage V sporulation protein AA [Aneurinibacillus tyrosinisolvens]